MNLDRIKGLLIQEFFITIRSYEVIMDILVFPVMSAAVFGFLATYLAGSADVNVANSLLSGMLLWQVIFIIQYSVSVGSLWNIWSRNLSNMFITPLSLIEYIFALSVSGILKALCVFSLTAFASILIFQFNIFQLGFINLLLYFLSLTFFALSLGVVILGLIFRFGTRIQAFAWGILPIFQPLTAAFYPVSVLPKPMQFIAYLLPPTHIFEAVRQNFQLPGVIAWGNIQIAFLETLMFFIAGVWFFNLMFNASKKSGQFARLEG